VASEAVSGSSAVGGGAAPTVEIPTALVRLTSASRRPDETARRLRLGTPAVVARIADDAVVLDLRTVDPADEDALFAAVVAAC
jgi:L-seryl-tRNA(Ser) seleniumtransferase